VPLDNLDVCCVNALPVPWERRRLACLSAGWKPALLGGYTLAQDLWNRHLAIVHVLVRPARQSVWPSPEQAEKLYVLSAVTP
jgi:hypothetical protein